MQPILKIDLTTGKHEGVQIPAEFERLYLGGASLAARLLYEKLTPALDPLSPEAPLLFLNGPLSGTSGPAVGRFVICGKSPQTGIWAESNCGGFWGPELRKTGFDGVWLTGKASKPVYLSIIDGKVEIRPAVHLWGQDTYKIQDSIKTELAMKGVRVAGIGVAAENQIPFSVVLCDHGRVAGRTGMGAVMGSKNLKAIAVRGSGKIPGAADAKFKQLRTALNKKLKTDNLTKMLRELGSGGGAEYFDYLGSMPKNGYTLGVMENSANISGSTIAENYLVGVAACHACVVACGRVVKLDEQSEKQKGHEYETMAGFGPNLGISDAAFVTRMGELCDRYGMDTITLSNTISLAFTLYQDGTITAADADGLSLDWGNRETVEKLVRMTAIGEGFGGLITKGARGLARHFGVEELAVQVKGLEAAFHDPRGLTGMALVYSTASRGACHNQGDYYVVDIGQADEQLGMEFFPRQGGVEKANNVVINQNYRSVSNALVQCIFGNVQPKDLLQLINVSCDLDWSLDDMLKSGERAWNLKRAINNRLGITREDDRLPQRFLEPLPDGGAAGFEIDFEPMLKAYYQIRGWDWETGKPTKEKLLELALDFAADDLWPE
ncbi:MAG: aldehyde ferredoxin oxidoreductase family protein [Chloroflexota bacterium]